MDSGILCLCCMCLLCCMCSIYYNRPKPIKRKPTAYATLSTSTPISGYMPFDKKSYNGDTLIEHSDLLLKDCAAKCNEFDTDGDQSVPCIGFVYNKKTKQCQLKKECVKRTEGWNYYEKT